MAYPGYGGQFPQYGCAPGGAPGAPGGAGYQQYQAQSMDHLYGYFAGVAGHDGQIDSQELQSCLTQAGISGSYKPFCLETCKLMISMLDCDCSGTMGFSEFKELWTALNAWRQNFATFDRDRSGTVDPQELQQAISSMGYRLSPQGMNAIVKRYSTAGKISFDDYVACFVRLRTLTDAFRRRDASQQGVVNFAYDDFIICTMCI